MELGIRFGAGARFGDRGRCGGEVADLWDRELSWRRVQSSRRRRRLRCEFAGASVELKREEMALEEEDMWERGVRLVSDLNSILEFDPYMYVVLLLLFSVWWTVFLCR